jgi:hypothetical protein
VSAAHAIAFALPLLPGRTEDERSALAACWTGPRREAHRDARRRAGITRETVWLQRTAGGDLTVVLLEADDLEQAASALGASPDPFDRWFREHVLEVHGIALADGLPAPERLLDFDVDDVGPP